MSTVFSPRHQKKHLELQVFFFTKKCQLQQEILVVDNFVSEMMVLKSVYLRMSLQEYERSDLRSTLVCE